MTREQFEALKIGDVIRHRGSHDAFVVHGNHAGTVTLVKVMTASNPIEWTFIGPERCPG